MFRPDQLNEPSWNFGDGAASESLSEMWAPVLFAPRHTIRTKSAWRYDEAAMPTHIDPSWKRPFAVSKRLLGEVVKIVMLAVTWGECLNNTGR
jgi:hypothetical protein